LRVLKIDVDLDPPPPPAKPIVHDSQLLCASETPSPNGACFGNHVRQLLNSPWRLQFDTC
jgi:hypothetical protein